MFNRIQKKARWQILLVAVLVIMVLVGFQPPPTPTPVPTAIPPSTQVLTAPPQQTGVSAPKGLSKTDLNTAIAATVQIVILNDDLKVVGGCSGSILTTDGIMLTNAHCVGDAKTRKLYQKEGKVGVALVADSSQPAVPRFIAQVRQVDFELDLAVIQPITTQSGGKLPEPLALPIVPQGEGKVEIGDEIFAIGFPGVGGDTVTLTRGIVSGFGSYEGTTGNWIKTDITIAPGNSGGMVINERGEIVGIPTLLITDRTTGSRIGLVRPLSFAQPYVKAARAGESNIAAQMQGTATVPKTITAVLGPITFAAEIDAKNQPVNPNSSFPAGIKQLYGFFEYQNMSPDDTMSIDWRIDGITLLTYAEKWKEGTAGSASYYIYKKDGSALEEGVYELRLSFGDKLLRSGEAIVGTAGAPSGVDQGVVITGKVVDFDSGLPINGAVIAILAPGVTVDKFLDEQRDDQIAAFAKTNANGDFQTSPALPRGNTYSILIGINGYRMIGEDNFLSIGTKVSSTLDLGVVKLSKR